MWSRFRGCRSVFTIPLLYTPSAVCRLQIWFVILFLSVFSRDFRCFFSLFLRWLIHRCLESDGNPPEKVCSRGFSPSILNAPNRDLKIRRRRVSTTAVASWGGMRRGRRCEVWKITLRTLVEDAVGFITGFRFFSENMASFRERSNLLLESFDKGGGGFPRTNSFFFKVQTPRKTQISLT